MTSAESLNLIVAIGAAVATALSALAAFRSARSADLAQRALDSDQLRAGRREVGQLVAQCSFELKRIEFLARTLRIIDRTTAVFTGGVGGSRAKVAEDGLKERLARAEALFSAASTFVSDPSALSRLTHEDSERLHIDLSVRLSELRAIAAELDRDSASREAQLLQHRERAINGGRS